MVHALEILDLLISPVLKPFVFPLLEGQSHLAIVRKLELLVPRQQFTPYEALRALVSRDYGRIGVWTRAVALDRLGRDAAGVPADLVAFLFHPEPMIREVAAIRIAARDRRAWETHRKRLGFDMREALDAVVGAADAQREARRRRSSAARSCFAACWRWPCCLRRRWSCWAPPRTCACSRPDNGSRACGTRRTRSS